MVNERVPVELIGVFRRLMAGETAARDTVARTHEALVIHWAMRYQRRWPWVESDDLVAEGRLAVLEALPHFRALHGASLTTFLDAAIRRRLRDYLAGMRPLPQEPEDESELDSLVEELPLDPELRERLRATLQFLPPRWRQVIELHYGLDGDKPLSFRRIARALGVSAQRVAQLHHSSIERLRWHWGE